ncbi:DNA polymerase beta superfamily protein [Xenorhabdus bovienii]|uniref:DNA polymerase beta superfamily protein n=1 Tax=Xenorhabdus bovienii TaxID=40576 RepID=UPI0023B2C381|nr:nucleotidyltransferase domain-containing protein [Xenorhabdus bovienii]
MENYLPVDICKLKKYFYVLRPLLAVRWIEMSKGVLPIDFETLVAGTVDNPQLKAEIGDLRGSNNQRMRQNMACVNREFTPSNKGIQIHR